VAPQGVVEPDGDWAKILNIVSTIGLGKDVHNLEVWVPLLIQVVGNLSISKLLDPLCWGIESIAKGYGGCDMAAVFFKTVWGHGGGVLLFGIEFFELVSALAKETNCDVVLGLLFVNGGKESPNEHLKNGGSEVVVV
jgi:hypothetical protein